MRISRKAWTLWFNACRIFLCQKIGLFFPVFILLQKQSTNLSSFPDYSSCGLIMFLNLRKQSVHAFLIRTIKSQTLFTYRFAVIFCKLLVILFFILQIGLPGDPGPKGEKVHLNNSRTLYGVKPPILGDFIRSSRWSVPASATANFASDFDRRDLRSKMPDIGDKIRRQSPKCARSCKWNRQLFNQADLAISENALGPNRHRKITGKIAK